MNTPSLGAKPRCIEEVRIGGGYASSPDGGAEIDRTGNAALDGDLTVDGGLAVGGDLEVGGVDTTWCVFRGAREGWPSFLNGCAGPNMVAFAGSWRLSWYALDFDKDTDKYATFNVVLPPDYDGRLLKITLFWTSTAGTAGTVRWRVYMRAAGDDAPLDNSTIDNFTLPDTLLAQSDMHAVSATRTPTNAAGGGVLVITVQREASHVDDTLNADARLIAIRLAYA